MITLPGKVERRIISGGDAGTLATAQRMAALVREGSTEPLVRQTAVEIVRAVPGRDYARLAQTVRAWLARKVQFLRDPYNDELLHSPAFLLTTLRQNPTIRVDCDDAAILGAALARAVGLRTRFVVVGFLSPEAPFRHVWAEAAGPIGNEWTELDVTRVRPTIPWDKITRVRYISVESPPTALPVVAGVLALCTVLWGSIFSRNLKTPL